MLLRDCKFLVSSYELRFVAYSDQPCKAVHLNTVRFDTPGASERVDFYRIDPAAPARWLAVQEQTKDKSRTRFFIHLGNEFEEHQRSEVSTALLVEIERRIHPPRQSQTLCRVKQKRRPAAIAVPRIHASAH